MQALSNTNRPVHELIALDHRSFDELYQRYHSFAGQQKEQQKIANELIREISTHSAAEETEVYPALVKHLENGESVNKHMLDEHQTVKDILVKLEKLTVGTPEYDALLKEVMDDLRHHAKDEENRQLPDLLAKTGYEEMVTLGQKFLAAKKAAPTRPHPMAPTQPTAELLVGLATKPVDKIRDMTQEFASRAVPEE
ncbi:hypothetical protein RI367_001731 [Sorochytrium milnesiophthora]